MTTVDFSTLTDRELLIVLALKMDSLELNVLGHVPQDCVAHQSRIKALEEQLEAIKDDVAARASKEELKEVKDSTTWAFRIAAGAVLAGLLDLGRWVLTSVIGGKQ